MEATGLQAVDDSDNKDSREPGQKQRKGFQQPVGSEKFPWDLRTMPMGADAHPSRSSIQLTQSKAYPAHLMRTMPLCPSSSSFAFIALLPRPTHKTAAPVDGGKDGLHFHSEAHKEVVWGWYPSMQWSAGEGS